MKEITFETARELGLIKDDSLEYAYKSVEGCSILSKATDLHFESVFRERKKQVKLANKYVKFNGELLLVI